MKIEINVRYDSDIQERIYKARNHFLMDWGTDPDFLILGKDEYFELCASITYGLGFDGRMQYLSNFMGMDIVLSSNSPSLHFGFKDAREWAMRLKSNELCKF